jgi:peptidyl-prolyl cis-trans isomerase D
LIQPSGQTTEAVNQAKKLADSLEQVIRKGADFTSLAMRFSADEGSKTKGGDLGWFTEGKMIKPFSDAAFSMQKNEVKVVETQYGFHVLQVTDIGTKLKKVKIATLIRKVEASKETYERIYEQANRFAFTNNTGDKFEKAVKEQSLVPRYAMSIKPTDTRISGLDSPREIIRWAMEAKVNDVSPVMQAGNRFIVARVTASRKAGIAPFEQVKPQIEMAVSRIKKGEYLAEQWKKKMADHTTLDQLALSENLPVNEATNVSFATTTIAGVGFEPALTGTIAAWPANKISHPVIGNNGVYVFEITSVQEPSEPDQLVLAMQKSRMASMYQMRAGYESFEALKKLSRIEDNRARFY